MRAFCCLVAAVAIGFLSTAAHAQVTSVEVVANAFVGVPVKVTVKGGACGAVTMDYGDPSDPNLIPDNNHHTVTIRSGQLPFFEDHTWHNEGIFTVKATGEGGSCPGTATAVVKVVKFTGVLKPRPKITGYFGFAKPGGVAAIVGTALGSTGTVTAKLKKFNGETLVIDTFEILKDGQGVAEWKPTLIGIKWPDVTGVRAQDATIRVKVGNFTSNEWTVPFRPDLEFKMLPRADVKVVSCSMDANDTTCNNVSDHAGCALDFLGGPPFTTGPGDASIFGMHGNCPAAIGDDSGTDVYQISLKNDWVLESFEFDKDLTGDDGDYVKNPTPAFPHGAATWKVSIKWLASVDDVVTYHGLIGISGPKGVPHK